MAISEDSVNIQIVLGGIEERIHNDLNMLTSDQWWDKLLYSRRNSQLFILKLYYMASTDIQYQKQCSLIHKSSITWNYSALFLDSNSSI